jgi:hypothetical protein
VHSPPSTSSRRCRGYPCKVEYQAKLLRFSAEESGSYIPSAKLQIYSRAQDSQACTSILDVRRKCGKPAAHFPTIVLLYLTVMSGTARPRPRPRPRPVPVVAEPPPPSASTPPPSTANDASSSTAPQHQAEDDVDVLFMRNRSRTASTWKKLNELDKRWLNTFLCCDRICVLNPVNV